MSSRRWELLIGPMRAIRRGGVLWAISLAALVAMTVAFWPAFKGATSMTEMLDQMPQGLIQAFGLQDFGTPAGFLRGNLYAFFLPLLIAGAGVGFANSLTASEEDAGRLEALLAQPVSRRVIFAGRAAAAFAWVAILAAATALVQLATDPLVGLDIGLDRLMATIVLCGLLGCLHAGLALALAGVAARPSLVLGGGIFVAVAGCTIASLFPLSEALKPWAHVSPWDWALSGDPLTNATEAWRYLALGLPAVALALLGIFAFGRRDVRAA
jgi:ABC-2 type transport system permease protein